MEGRSEELQAVETHFYAWEDGTDPPGRHVKAHEESETISTASARQIMTNSLGDLL